MPNGENYVWKQQLFSGAFVLMESGGGLEACDQLHTGVDWDGHARQMFTNPPLLQMNTGFKARHVQIDKYL